MTDYALKAPKINGGESLKRSKLILPLLLCLLFLAGCSGEAIESYFSLPKSSDDYLQLQELVDAEIASGCEYAAPSGGSYRQSLQLHDLDGDGEDEAVVFLRDAAHNGRIVIYKLYRGRYEAVLTLRGEGTAVGSVDYSDLNGDGAAELSVAWRVGQGLKYLTVYDLDGWGGAELLSCGCSEFIICDMDGSGPDELMVIDAEADGGGSVSLYLLAKNADALCLTARLSRGVSELERIRSCLLEDDVPALLVESACEDGALVSDLFVLQNEELRNITLNNETGISRTKRSYTVYASDIDSDRHIEIPSPSSLFSQSTADRFWSIAWNGYSADGEPTEKLDSYHSYADGWYFILPDGWHETLTVRRADDITGERSIILSELNRSTGEVSDKLIIYTLTGENRQERSHIAGRFVIREEDTTIYAASIISGISEEEVKERFKLAYAEWSTGAV